MQTSIGHLQYEEVVVAGLTRLAMAVTVLVPVILTGQVCSGQIMFSKINPGRLEPAKIERKQFHQVPMQRGIEYSRPSLPKPRLFENDRIHPHHLYVAPITMPNIKFDDLRARKIVQPRFHRETIPFENIKPQALERNIVAPRELAQQASLPQHAHIDFDPRMQGFSKPTTRFDSSIYLHPRNPPQTGTETRTPAGSRPTTTHGRTLGW